MTDLPDSEPLTKPKWAGVDPDAWPYADTKPSLPALGCGNGPERGVCDDPACKPCDKEAEDMERALEQPTTLATPCADCGHAFNWHRDGLCTVTAGPNGCGCGGFTAFHDEPEQPTESSGCDCGERDCYGECCKTTNPTAGICRHGHLYRDCITCHRADATRHERARIVGEARSLPSAGPDEMVRLADLLAAIGGEDDCVEYRPGMIREGDDA